MRVIMFTRQPTQTNYPNLRTDPHSRIHVKNHSNTCIDLADHGNGANGTSVQLWSDNGNKNQKWEAQKVD